jgi:hypothetical protein
MNKSISHGWSNYFSGILNFLMDDIPELSLEQRQSLGISSETFGLISGMKPHSEELAIQD